MTALMHRILEDKRQGRADLAARPFAEKVAMLEKMRVRHDLIATSPLRHSHVSNPVRASGHKV
jgi:hypothetical protein